MIIIDIVIIIIMSVPMPGSNFLQTSYLERI